MLCVPLTHRLRDQTRDLHLRVERAVDLPSRCRSADSYRDLLLRMLGFYAPFEEGLARFAWQPAGLDFEEGLRTGWLRDDLAALGLSEEEIGAAPMCRGLHRPPDLAGALGCLYVIEGASLGGQYIARAVRGSLQIDPTTGGRFFAGHGPDTGRRWQAFRAAADRYCSTDEAKAANALDGATATFEAFEEWLRT